MATTTFKFSSKPGSFRDSIRAYRKYKKEWQERINRELDEREEVLKQAKAEFQLEKV